MENTEYLQPGFDPSTLRVADLRRIFVFHEVDYPSSAKKADLVQIFRDEVSPRADELLKQVENVEPTSAGIVDAPRRRTTRSASPAKSSAPATKKAPASPRKSPTKGRKTSAEKKEEKVPELSSEPLLKPPKEEQPDEEKKTSSARSPSPKKKGGRKTLSKPFVEPTEDVKEEKKPVVDTPSVYKVGGKNTRKKTEEETPAKPKKAVLKSDSEDKMDVDKKEEEDDEGSPFSDKNIFQTGTPPTKSRKSVEKKRSFPFDVKDEDSKHKRRSKQLSSETPSSQDKATPQRAVDLSSRKSTPGTALRHFSSFPSTPDDEAGDATAEFITPEQQLQQSRLRASFPQSAQQPSAAPPSSSFNDHTYKPATEKVNKRLSFMPDISDLKMSNQFSQQLHEDRRKSSPLQFSKPDPDQPETVLVETGQANPKSPPPPLEQDHEDVEVKKLEDEVKQEEEQEEEQEEDVKEKPSKPKKKKSRKTAAVRSSGKPWTFYAERIFGLFVVSAICGYIYWWCQERVNVGYCDVGFITDDADFDYEQEKSPLELVVDQLRPECVPCPAHATCYPHFKAICDEDFKYRENLFSFGGLLPIPPTCLPDTEKQHRIMALSSRAKQILRERNAEVECGYIDASTAAIEEDDLRDLLYKDKKAEITDEEWNDLWRQAVKDLDNEEDIIIQRIHKSVKGYSPHGEAAPDLVTKTKVIQSTSLAYLPLTCRVQRTIRGSLERHRGQIQLFFLAVLALIGARFWYNAQQAHNAKVSKYASDAFQKLQQQQKMSEDDTKGLIPRHVAAAHLRDAMLMDLRGKKKDQLWKDVQKTVESNTNVRVRQVEVHGEIMKVWEWVSPTSPQS